MMKMQTLKATHAVASRQDQAQTFAQSTIARAISLVSAIAVSLLILLFPQALYETGGHFNHAVLSLWMWGMAAGFVDGVGYTPRYLVWRVLLGPWVAWSFMSCCGLWLLIE